MLFGGEKSDIRTAEAGGYSQGLAFAGDYIGSVVSRRLEHPHGGGVGGHDEQGFAVMGRRRMSGHVFYVSKMVGVLYRQASSGLSSISGAA